MPKLIFNGGHEAEIRRAVRQCSIPCKITKQIVQKRKKRDDKVIVDIAPNHAVSLPLLLADAEPIGGWPAYSYVTVDAKHSDPSAAVGGAGELPEL